MKSRCRRKCSGQFDKGMVRRSASAGRFLLSVNYHYSNLYLSTTRFIIENMSVEVDHDNIGYDKRVVWETEY